MIARLLILLGLCLTVFSADVTTVESEFKTQNTIWVKVTTDADSQTVDCVAKFNGTDATTASGTCEVTKDNGSVYHCIEATPANAKRQCVFKLAKLLPGRKYDIECKVGTGAIRTANITTDALEFIVIPRSNTPAAEKDSVSVNVAINPPAIFADGPEGVARTVKCAKLDTLVNKTFADLTTTCTVFEDMILHATTYKSAYQCGPFDVVSNATVDRQVVQIGCAVQDVAGTQTVTTAVQAVKFSTLVVPTPPPSPPALTPVNAAPLTSLTVNATFPDVISYVVTFPTLQDGQKWADNASPKVKCELLKNDTVVLTEDNKTPNVGNTYVGYFTTTLTDPNRVLPSTAYSVRCTNLVLASGATTADTKTANVTTPALTFTVTVQPFHDAFVVIPNDNLVAETEDVIKCKLLTVNPNAAAGSATIYGDETGEQSLAHPFAGKSATRFLATFSATAEQNKRWAVCKLTVASVSTYSNVVESQLRTAPTLTTIETVSTAPDRLQFKATVTNPLYVDSTLKCIVIDTPNTQGPVEVTGETVVTQELEITDSTPNTLTTGTITYNLVVNGGNAQKSKTLACVLGSAANVTAPIAQQVVFQQPAVQLLAITQPNPLRFSKKVEFLATTNLARLTAEIKCGAGKTATDAETGTAGTGCSTTECSFSVPVDAIAGSVTVGCAVTQAGDTNLKNATAFPAFQSKALNAAPKATFDGPLVVTAAGRNAYSVAAKLNVQGIVRCKVNNTLVAQNNWEAESQTVTDVTKPVYLWLSLTAPTLDDKCSPPIICEASDAASEPPTADRSIATALPAPSAPLVWAQAPSVVAGDTSLTVTGKYTPTTATANFGCKAIPKDSNGNYEGGVLIDTNDRIAGTCSQGTCSVVTPNLNTLAKYGVACVLWEAGAISAVNQPLFAPLVDAETAAPVNVTGSVTLTPALTSVTASLTLNGNKQAQCQAVLASAAGGPTWQGLIGTGNCTKDAACSVIIGGLTTNTTYRVFCRPVGANVAVNATVTTQSVAAGTAKVVFSVNLSKTGLTAADFNSANYTAVRNAMAGVIAGQLGISVGQIELVASDTASKKFYVRAVGTVKVTVTVSGVAEADKAKVAAQVTQAINDPNLLAAAAAQGVTIDVASFKTETNVSPGPAPGPAPGPSPSTGGAAGLHSSVFMVLVCLAASILF